MNASGDMLSMRVLACLPTARDTELTGAMLAQDGIQVQACRDGEELAAELQRGAGALLFAEEVLARPGARAHLHALLGAQPRWSDVPVLLLTRSGADSVVVHEAVATLGNVTLMERPLRVAALVTTVRAALRARDRQYQLRSYLQEVERARAAQASEARRKDEFLAMLAHELRNPLAPIRNALTVLDMDDSDPEQRRSMRAMMRRQVDHMIRMVDDLVEASRLSQGKVTLRRTPLDLRDVLRDALELGRAQDGGWPTELSLSLPEAPLPMQADPVRLAQVFGNLVNNALKYGRPGGRVDIVAESVDGQAVVRVRDDGVGMEPELLPHVFELFTQGRRETHRLQDGLGIGLALVHGLVGMHGGSVEARSDGRGHGSEFVVRLPLDASASVALRDPTPALPASGPDLPRVLVVDDNIDAANSLAMVLEALGIEHRVAHDGQAALDEADRFAPDVGLLDIGMPGMDGYELARRLRADPAHAHMVLAAVTGWSDAQDHARSRAAGFDHHFSKPADMNALTAMLAAAPRGVHAS